MDRAVLPIIGAFLFVLVAREARAADGGLAAACKVDADCGGGHCADDVCCDSACDATCDRCNLAGKEGTCTVAPAGNPGECAPYACDGTSTTSCFASCTTDAMCGPDFFCAADGTCKQRKLRGAPCGDPKGCKEPSCRECRSGFCVDGMCCNEACTADCMECKNDTLGVGTCRRIDNYFDPNVDGISCYPTKCISDYVAQWYDGGIEDCGYYPCINSMCWGGCSSTALCKAPAVCVDDKCVLPDSNGGCSTSSFDGGAECAALAAIAMGLAAFARRKRRRVD